MFYQMYIPSCTPLFSNRIAPKFSSEIQLDHKMWANTEMVQHSFGLFLRVIKMKQCKYLEF